MASNTQSQSTSIPSTLFAKNRIAIELLLNDTINYVVGTFKQNNMIFSVASAYGQIIFVLENLTQLILYYIEDSITELNINTATRANSVYGIAQAAGHNVTRAISSTGQLAFSVTPNTDTIAGGVIVIPNYTQLKCTNNNLAYIVDLPSDDIRIASDGSQNGTLVNIIQGQIETQTFTGTGGNLQTFSCSYQQSALIDNFNVNVYVNGDLWKPYDGLYDIPLNGQGYLVKTGLIDGIDIVFGNGYAGKQPPLGSTINVEYLTTTGEAGNLHLADGDAAAFKWVDSGYDIYGNELDLNSLITITTPVPPDFGTNPEPLALTRIIAPKTSRNFVLANPDNYVIFIEKFNMFSIVDAFQTAPVNAMTDDKVIYLFLIPNINDLITSNENYFNIPESQFTLTASQQAKLLQLIADSGSAIMGTEVQITNPIISRFVINIALIVFDNVNENTVMAAVIQRLSSYFLAVRRRDRIPRSDLITIIENVDGVDSLNISIISQIDEQTALAAATTRKLSSAKPAPPHIDQFGDILIYTNELPIIRGGWTDRHGMTYNIGISQTQPSSVNILIEEVVPVTYNTAVNTNNINNIRNGNVGITNITPTSISSTATNQSSQ